MARQDDLYVLNEFLTFKRLLLLPAYRRHFMAALGVPIIPGTLRVVRAVERSQTATPYLSDIAEEMVVDASTATRLADKAVKQGYLEKVPDPEDPLGSVSD
jgi:DNA-binding MarR family transcriptional regulator